MHQTPSVHFDRGCSGWMFDFSHSYMLPILLSAAGNVGAAILVLRGWSQGTSR